MSGEAPRLGRIALEGLELACAQVRGGVRLVPLLRRRPSGDLRLALEGDDELPDASCTVLASYAPHGAVLGFGERGAALATLGTRLWRREGRPLQLTGVRLVHRLSRREETRRLRLLPLHLAVEGLLARRFGGPEIAWSEYSQQALRQGVSPGGGPTMPGELVHGLEDALRVFELHDDQVGLLLFVANSLAAAFVTPHPADYRRLHPSLLEDLYGELIYQFGELYPEELPLTLRLDEGRVSSIDDLRLELSRLRRRWADLHAELAAGLLEREAAAEVVTHLGPFRLVHLLTPLDPRRDNHLGEAILRDDGTLEYLKTYRLSAAQCRRALLLQRLSEAGWSLDEAAARAAIPRKELIRRLDNAGLAYLLKDEVLRQAGRR